MIYPIISHGMDSNCYLLVDEKVALIDSGMSGEMVQRTCILLNETGREIDLLINTHCHYDHIANNYVFKEKFKDMEIAIHTLDALCVEGENANVTTLSTLFAREFHKHKFKIDKKLNDNDVISLGKMNLKVIHTPGHSKGSICLYGGGTRSLFSGDTIFADGIGRTDLYGGSFESLKGSIKKLLELEVDTVYPGHGRIGTYENMKEVYGSYF